MGLVGYVYINNNGLIPTDSLQLSYLKIKLVLDRKF